MTRTAPTFDSLTTVWTGGVFARRHTITRRILAAGDVARKHCSSSAAKHRRASRTRPELAVEMLTLLCHHRKPRHFHVVADSAYGGQSVLCHLPTNCDLTSRLLKDARLYAAPHRALRVVAVEAVRGGRGQEVFSSTCSDATAEQIRGWSATRWSIEVRNHDSKQHLASRNHQAGPAVRSNARHRWRCCCTA